MLDDITPWLDEAQAEDLDLGPVAGCQWIEGEPSRDDGCKCGQPIRPGSPYCAAHGARARLHVPARRVQAHFDRLAKEAWEVLFGDPLALTGDAARGAAE
jgi:GcrA cell cycle regulator